VVGLAAYTFIGCAHAMDVAKLTAGTPEAYAAMSVLDDLTGTVEYNDPAVFQASVRARMGKSKKGTDPDFPTYHQAMQTPEASEWMGAMDKEISTLNSLGTWTVVRRADVLAQGRRVLKSTWAFRKKRLPNGEISKYKARFCVRGDMQVEGEDFFESYAPVVQWSSVRLMLIMSIVHGLHTRQVDYVNAFAQADLPEDVFIDMPQGYSNDSAEDCVLQLNKSLYGLRQAPVKFFELLKGNLKKMGFKQQEGIDPCLFIHPDMICLTYVDDCLWFSAKPQQMDDLIEKLGTMMTLTVEGNDVSAFLGIQFKRVGKTIELTQVGLIDRILKAMGLENCEVKHTPAENKPLGSDKQGPAFKEDWSYASVVGMFLYLASNSRPDIAFAVHQAARFTHNPKQSHAVALKRIARYLQGTKSRGLILKPTGQMKVDCYVDADFAGLWGSEDPDDPIVAKSRTGYLVLYAGCPLLWVSKLQTEVSLSTMMSEYVALSTAMRDMIPIKTLVKAVAEAVTGQASVNVDCCSDVFEDNNGALALATMPRITPQSKFFAVKYHFFREKVFSGEINVRKVHTMLQLADILTKGLVKDKFVPLRDRLMGWTDDSDIYCDPTVYKAPTSDSRGSVEKNEKKVSANEAVGLIVDGRDQRKQVDTKDRRKRDDLEDQRKMADEEEQRKQ
jgi:hypothetical protein